MGGSAFTSPPHPLRVPRLPTPLHTALTAHYTTILSSFFTRVASPREPPGKPDHGDVDVLVCAPTGWTQAYYFGVAIPERVREEIGAALGAARWTREAAHAVSFAVPLAQGALPLGHEDGEGEAHVQVDVHMTAPEVFDWVFFKLSDGDLWQLLGLAIRPFGLTANEVALYLRVQRVEEVQDSRKASLLFLSNDVGGVLRFLGLDDAAYRAGFGSERALFEYAASSRFFSRGVLLERGANENANDRQRYRKRAMFRRFLDEWLPAWEGEDGRAVGWTRDEVVDAAVESFGERVRVEHDGMVAKADAYALEQSFWEDVAGKLPVEELVGAGQAVQLECNREKKLREKKNRVLRGFKRWVEFDENTQMPSLRKVAEMDGEKQPVWTQKGVERGKLMEWAMDNWKDVERLEKERVKVATELGKRAKAS